MKKIIKRRKQKINKLLQQVKANDLTLSAYLNLLSKAKEVKQERKKSSNTAYTMTGIKLSKTVFS